MKRRKLLFMAICTLSVILVSVLIALWWHLEKDDNAVLEGFNSELPQGKEQEMESSKSKAYEMILPSDSVSHHIATLTELEKDPEQKEDAEIYDDQPKKSVEYTITQQEEYQEPHTINEITDTVKVEEKPKKREFISATTSSASIEQTEGIMAIAACIHQDQKVKDGSRIKIRTLEKFEISGITIDKGTILTGVSKFEGDRIKIDITSIKSRNNIIQSKLSVYDNDGQEGIYYPVSQEESAIKNIGSDITRRIGSSIGTSGIAGSVISGGVDYISEKSSRKNVILCSDYKIFLIKL